MKNKKNTLNILLVIVSLINPVDGFCQSQDFIRGYIFNSEDKSPISYVNIVLKNTAFGTITNEVGEFVLSTPYLKTQYKEDTISISAIGYHSYNIKVADIHTDTLYIYLNPYPFLLKEVVVKDNQEMATVIVSRMVSNIEKNYMARPYQMKGFYREANIQDTSFTRFIEAFALIHDKGYKNNLEDMRIKVLQLRKSDDNRDLDWKASLFEWIGEKNGLYVTLAKDRLRKKSIGIEIETREYHNEEDSYYKRFLSSSFVTSMSFSLDSIGYYDNDSIYFIRYEPIKPIIRFEKITGKMLIKKSDYALIEINTHITLNKAFYEKNTAMPPMTKEKMLKVHENRSIDGSLFSEITIKYKKHQDKYFLQYIGSKSTGTNSISLQANLKTAINSKYEKGKFYQFNQFIVTEIITEKDKMAKISKSDDIDKKDDLYDLDMPYNPLFWKNAGVIPLSPISQKMLRDLEKEKSLEQQFIDNGD